MEKYRRKIAGTAVGLLCCITVVLAQTNISGTVSDGASGDPLAGVNIVVKGRVVGTITDTNGSFNLNVNASPPLTLVFTFVGYRSQEVSITNPTTSGLDVKLEEQTLLGQEVVISASRVEESILKSPVTIEKLDLLAIRQSPAADFFDALANV